MVKIIKDANEWKKCLEENKKLVADFFAEWCGPCRMVAPEFENTAGKINDVCFVKVNVDSLNELAQQYKVMSIPTLIMFENGQEIKRNTGFMDSKTMVEWIDHAKNKK